jgi:hypothetical protein
MIIYNFGSVLAIPPLVFLRGVRAVIVGIAELRLS